MSRPPLTVVVPCRNRDRLLDGCLAALRADLRPTDDVLVVDSASDTPAVAAVAAGHDVRVLRADRPGASHARNLGWRAARTPVVAFVDDDCLVRPGWADALAADFAADDTGFVVGRLVVPEEDGPVDQPVSVVTGTRRRRLPPDAPVVGASANLAVRVRLLEQVGGFDERMGPGTPIPAAEDLDLFDRLQAAGVTGVFDPDVLVAHRQWRRGGAHLRLHWQYGKGAGGRLAKTYYVDRGRARRLAPEVLRLGGAVTVARDLATGRPRNRLPGLVWRAGALVGVVSGAWRLRPGRRP